MENQFNPDMPAPGAYEMLPSDAEIQKLNEFKTQYPQFADFLQNKEFEALFNGGAEIVPIKTGSAKYEEITKLQPYKHTSSIDNAVYLGSGGQGVKIIFRNNDGGVVAGDVALRQTGTNLDNSINFVEEEVEYERGETVKEAMDRLGLGGGNDIVFVVFPETDQIDGELVAKIPNSIQSELKKGIKMFLVQK